MRDGADGVRGGEFALHCRGDVRLYCGQVDCTPKSRKGRALLAILAAEQRPLTRVRIIDLLWSDRQEEQARASLRTLLADLREQFGGRFDELLVVDRERVALGPSIRTDLTDPSLARPAGELFEGLDHIDPELDEWLRLEREKWEKQGDSRRATIVADFGKPRQSLPRWAWAAILILALAVGALLNFRPWAKPEQPVVAVLKFKDLTGQNALLADGLAEELRIQLAQHPRLQVIGRESSENESVQSGNFVELAREKLSATHIVEGSIINRDSRPQASIRLVDADRGALVWSQVLAAEGGMIRNGSAAIAARLAGNINETFARGATPFAADAHAYETLFAARRALRTGEPAEATRAREALLPIVKQYPNFAPALAVLAEATMRSSDHPFARGTIPLSQARREAEAFARRAIAAAPDFGPGYTALGSARMETEGALAPVRKAVKLNPGSFETHQRLARSLELASDLQGSLAHNRIAAKLEPLDLQSHYMLVRLLIFTGNRREVPGLISGFVERTDDRFTKFDFISAAAGEIGDISAAYIATTEVLKLQPDSSQARRMLMWMKIWLGDRDGALAYTSSPKSLTAIMLRNDVRALKRTAAAMGFDFWSLDWESVDASEYLVRTGHSSTVVALYDHAKRAAGGRPVNLYNMGTAVAVALRQAKRFEDANFMVEDAVRILDRVPRSAPHLPIVWAEIFALQGKNDEALAQLELAMRNHWWNFQPSVVPIFDRVVFRDLRNHPRFRALVRTYQANIEREKRELAADLKRFGDKPIDPAQLI